ncbi:MAG TPA: hypothetical protein VKV74_09055 [Bryobacteraceae bacterium]|nr:hypothetical protein [Bryobacteraceae bacterium]
MISRLRFVAAATPQVAAKIGASWMLDPRAPTGVRVPISFEMESVTLLHELKIQKSNYRLRIKSERVDHFRVFRADEELMVTFVASVQGAMFELIEHILKVGCGEGTCTLDPIQEGMFGDEPIEEHLRGEALEQHKLAARKPYRD